MQEYIWGKTYMLDEELRKIRPLLRVAIDYQRLIDENFMIPYVEEAYPNLIFAKDGEIYDIDGKKTMVIGGAYSIDKWYRLKMNYKWFESEQISEEEKRFVEKQLEDNDWRVDVVLSHTLPYQYRPVDMFIKLDNELMVDDTMEKWLRDIEAKMTYEKWYAGHFHCDRKTDRLQIMYRNVELFCQDVDLKFSME